MFAKYIIVENGLENIVQDGKVIGYRLKNRIPYYRGISLSMVEQLNLTVDGESIPSDTLQITVHGNTYSLVQMEEETKDRWEFGEIGMIAVPKIGGLPIGEHTIELSVMVRVSYRPVGQVVGDKKTLFIR